MTLFVKTTGQPQLTLLMQARNCGQHWRRQIYIFTIQLFLHEFESPSGDGGFPNRRCISYHSEIYRFGRFIEQVIPIQGMIAAYFVVVVIGSSVDLKK